MRPLQRLTYLARERFSRLLDSLGAPPTRHKRGYSGRRASRYLSSRASTAEWAKENVALGTFAATLSNGLSVLDVPFGTGRALPVFAAKSWQVTGVDLSADMMAQARLLNGGAYPFEMIPASATGLPFADEHFDVVVSLRFLASVLPFEDAMLALVEMLRVSRSHVILEVAFASELGIEPAGNYMRRRMDAAKFDLLLHENGFQVTHRTRVRKAVDSSDWLILARRK